MKTVVTMLVLFLLCSYIFAEGNVGVEISSNKYRVDGDKVIVFASDMDNFSGFVAYKDNNGKLQIQYFTDTPKVALSKKAKPGSCKVFAYSETSCSVAKKVKGGGWGSTPVTRLVCDFSNKEKNFYVFVQFEFPDGSFKEDTFGVASEEESGKFEKLYSDKKYAEASFVMYCYE